jgi:hypothetical protein
MSLIPGNKSSDSRQLSTKVCIFQKLQRQPKITFINIDGTCMFPSINTELGQRFDKVSEIQTTSN